MDSVLFFAQMTGHWDQSFNAENTDSILVILRKLSEDWEELLDHVLLIKLSREFSKSSSTSSSDHGSVFLAEFHEFLSQALFLRVGSRVSVEEQTS